jgi:hypothetical protein
VYVFIDIANQVMALGREMDGGAVKKNVFAGKDMSYLSCFEEKSNPTAAEVGTALEGHKSPILELARKSTPHSLESYYIDGD